MVYCSRNNPFVFFNFVNVRARMWTRTPYQTSIRRWYTYEIIYACAHRNGNSRLIANIFSFRLISRRIYARAQKTIIFTATKGRNECLRKRNKIWKEEKERHKNKENRRRNKYLKTQNIKPKAIRKREMNCLCLKQANRTWTNTHLRVFYSEGDSRNVTKEQKCFRNLFI